MFPPVDESHESQLQSVNVNPLPRPRLQDTWITETTQNVIFARERSESQNFNRPYLEIYESPGPETGLNQKPA